MTQRPQRNASGSLCRHADRKPITSIRRIYRYRERFGRLAYNGADGDKAIAEKLIGRAISDTEWDSCRDEARRIVRAYWRTIAVRRRTDATQCMSEREDQGFR